MYGKAGGLDRFKKAQTLEPFSVDLTQSQPKQVSSSAAATAKQPPVSQSQIHSYRHQHQHQHQHQQQQHSVVDVRSSTTTTTSSSSSATQLGGSQSNWQPPDWAIEPRPCVYYLEVLKDGDILDRIPLHKRRHIFGRQFHTCDFVLDHQSVSRQHAAVVPHKNGSIYVIDLGSAHGTFVANERLAKDIPVELEVGQSLRFAASTRTYILRKNEDALFPPTPAPTDIDLLSPPDPSDVDALVAYNTLLNRYGITTKSHLSLLTSSTTPNTTDTSQPERLPPNKRLRKTRVVFRDQVGGDLVQVVGVSDGADVETEPGPLGLKEGSLVGKYESLVQITVIPKGKELEHPSLKEENLPQAGVTDKLQQVLNKVKNTPSSKIGIYDDLYGETFSGKVGSSWAHPSATSGGREPSQSNCRGRDLISPPNSTQGNNKNQAGHDDDDDDDDLFGD